MRMKVLVVGLGSIARKHISALREIDPEARIYALRSQANAGREKDITNLYDTADIPADIDFAIISNPTSCHARTIDSLKELNVPLLIEKPVFGSADHDKLVEEVRKSGILTYVACNLRFLDCIVFLKNYLRSNSGRRINEVNVYCGSYLPEWRPGTDFKKCYSAIPELGGGVHIDLIHEIDYVRWLFGLPAEVSSIFRNVSSLGIRAIDYANYIFTYPEFTASIILNYYRRDYKRQMEIVFEDDTWTVDLKSNSIRNSKSELIFEGKNDFLSTYKSQMEYFINLVETGDKSENDIAMAYDVLKICMNHERSER